jgi:tRNA-binding protein
MRAAPNEAIAWDERNADAARACLTCGGCGMIGFMPTEPGADAISLADFDKVDIRVGRVVCADPFPDARKPAYKLLLDFGPEIGERTSSAQLTVRYRRDELEGRLVIAVINFPPRQIGPFVSQVLTLGVPDASGAVVLLAPDQDVPVGGRMF